MQPKGDIRVACGALPLRWLTEQGHMYFQHLLQTLARVPKKIDGEEFVNYHDQLTTEIPDHITVDDKAKVLHNELVMQTESVLTDQASGILVDTRPMAIAAYKVWEDKLQGSVAKAESQDRLSAQKSWRLWAIEAASAGAGKAHRWSKVPQSWRPNTARKAPADHDAEPLNLLNELCEKFKGIWQPASSPIPVPNCVVFPSWLPDLPSSCSEDRPERDQNDSSGWTIVVHSRRRKGRQHGKEGGSPAATRCQHHQSQQGIMSRTLLGCASGTPAVWPPDASIYDEPLAQACRAVAERRPKDKKALSMPRTLQMPAVAFGRELRRRSMVCM